MMNQQLISIANKQTVFIPRCVLIAIPRKQNYGKMSEELTEYVDLFRNFSDDAAPAPEVEIKVKGSSKEFCQKYLTNKKYIVIEVKPGFIYLHCKPKYLFPLLDLEEVEHLEKVPGIYEPM